MAFFLVKMAVFYLFLVGVVFLGVITSYTDIQFGKIRNRHVVFALFFSLILHFLLVFFEEKTRPFLFQTTTNFVSVLFVGYLMWDVGLWTAGDGKLFLAYSSLTPLFVYSGASRVPFFPAMNILINTFVPLFLFFFIVLIFKTSFTQKKTTFKKALNIKRIFFLVVSLFVFFWVIDFLSVVLGVELNFFMYIVLLFLLVAPIERAMPNKFYGFLVVVALFRLFFDKSIFTLHFFKTFFYFIFVFIFLRFFLLELGFVSFTTSLPISKLKPGMVPAELIYKQEKEIIRKRILFFSFFTYLKERNNKSVFDIGTEGLKAKDIENIKKLARKHPDLKAFQVQQTLPFAPFLFFGVILTLIARGNIFIFLKLFF